MRRVSKGSKGSTSAFLDPLIQTAQAGDQAGFDLAYRVIVQGCNDCHAAQTYGQIGRPFSATGARSDTSRAWSRQGRLPSGHRLKQ